MNSLDDLVHALQSALGTAQRALMDRQRAHVVRQVQLDAGSEIEGESWFLSVETGEFKDGKPVVAQIPMLSLVRVAEMRPAVMKIEMLATIEAIDPPGGKQKGLLGLRVGGSNARADKPGMHKVLLELSGEDYKEVEVRVNGKLLKKFGGSKGEEEK
jgi:hypothetical protein